MPKPTTRNEKRNVAIVEAALLVFARYGFKKTSMDDLAKGAGLSRQGLYLHFKTKEALFKEAVVRALDGQREGFHAALAQQALSLEERLLAAFLAYHGNLIGAPLWEHLDELMAAAMELMAPAFAKVEQDVVAELTRVLRAHGAPASRKGDGPSAKELAEHLYASSHGWKDRGVTQAVYLQGMRVAIQLTCQRLD